MHATLCHLLHDELLSWLLTCLPSARRPLPVGRPLCMSSDTSGWRWRPWAGAPHHGLRRRSNAHARDAGHAGGRRRSGAQRSRAGTHTWSRAPLLLLLLLPPNQPQPPSEPTRSPVSLPAPARKAHRPTRCCARSEASPAPSGFLEPYKEHRQRARPGPGCQRASSALQWRPEGLGPGLWPARGTMRAAGLRGRCPQGPPVPRTPSRPAR